MNNEQKINLIKKSIEEQTGKCEVMQTPDYISFYWKEETGMQRVQIPNSILYFLPIKESLEEQWIPVSERLPEKFQLALCTFREYGQDCIGSCQYINGEFIFNATLLEVPKMMDIGQQSVPKITHWQPLPNAPLK